MGLWEAEGGGGEGLFKIGAAKHPSQENQGQVLLVKIIGLKIKESTQIELSEIIVSSDSLLKL